MRLGVSCPLCLQWMVYLEGNQSHSIFPANFHRMIDLSLGTSLELLNALISSQSDKIIYICVNVTTNSAVVFLMSFIAIELLIILFKLCFLSIISRDLLSVLPA